MAKWPVQKPTHRKTQKHVEHQDATDILLFTRNIELPPWYGQRCLKCLQCIFACDCMVDTSMLFEIKDIHLYWSG